MLTSLKDAKKRIHICSPYFNPETIEYIDFLKSKNPELDIKLLLSLDEKIDQFNKNQKKFFKEYFIGASLNENSLKKEEIKNNINNLNKKKTINSIVRIICILIFFYLNFFFYKYNIKDLKLIFISIIIFILSIFLFNRKIKKINNLINFYKNIDTLHIDYFKKSTDLNIKISKSNPLAHVKLYIIDNVAYLGSINFSNTALFFNIESLIEIKDENAVNKLNEYFLKLYDCLKEINIETFAINVFDEIEFIENYKQNMNV